jgi:putative transposase
VDSVPPFINDWSPEDHQRFIAEMQGLVGEAFQALLRQEGLQQEAVNSWRRALLEFLAALPSRRWLDRGARHGQREQAEARALLKLWEERGAEAGPPRRWRSSQERQRILSRVDEARRTGARLKPICAVLGLSMRTLQRWRTWESAGSPTPAPRRSPANRLSDVERAQILAVLQSEEYRRYSPRQLVPRLADQGLYLASESTMYRLLRANPRRSRSRSRARSAEPTVVVIDAPNQVWCWDITRLKSLRRGASFHLYLVMDAFSRRIMGCEVHERQCMRRAAGFIRRTCEANGLDPQGLVLHSDNGRPMRGVAMSTALRRLGIISSFNRPHVHDDNPFPEALFRTLKDRPSFPQQPFESLQAARLWVEQFVTWYNSQHHHSALCFVTPDDRYFGRERAVLTRRRRVYERMRTEQPLRWPGHPRKWSPAGPLRIRVRPWHPPQLSLSPSASSARSGDNPVDTHRSR